MSEKFKAVPAVYLVMERNEQALFMHRYQTGYQDGKYMLPGGGIERGEPPTEATVREAREELGIEIAPENLQLIHIMYRAPHDETGERVDFFFRTQTWNGEPTIREPNKCDGLEWFPLNGIPNNVPPYVRGALKNAQEHIIYSEVDWPIK